MKQALLPLFADDREDKATAPVALVVDVVVGSDEEQDDEGTGADDEDDEEEKVSTV